VVQVSSEVIIGKCQTKILNLSQALDNPLDNSPTGLTEIDATGYRPRQLMTTESKIFSIFITVTANSCVLKK